MKKEIEKALNEQIEKECYSSQLYLSMASWTESLGYEGFAQWLYAQADEERQHMLKIIHYVNERGAKAVTPGIKKPPVDFKDIFTVFKQTLEHEEFITNSINEIVGVCIKEKDFTTQNWIQWFVNEQIMEEKAARAIIDKLNILGKDNKNLYLLDKDIMAMRAAAVAAEAAGGA